MFDVKKVILKNLKKKYKSNVLYDDIKRICEDYKVNENINNLRKANEESKFLWGIDLKELLFGRKNVGRN